MTTEPVFCAPLGMEARALRRDAHLTGVVHTGVGRRRSVRAVGRPPVLGAGGVAVTGIAGALDPGLRPGDVVVADEVTGPDGQSTRLPGAPLLAARLRRAGLSCRLGGVTSRDRLVSGSGRRQVAHDGAIAVDMESAWLLDGGRPEAVVRVIADTASERLLRPATMGRVRSALAVLADTGPALRDWRAALGPRDVVLAAPRSFCAGVDRAIDVVELALEQRGRPVYVRKQIVHNRHVVGDLAQRGAVFVDDLDDVPVGATVVFSAHGVSPAVREQARRRQLDVIDATCPLVTKVHSEVRRFGDRGDTVVFIGHAGHEETEGTMGERPGRTVLVENVDDVASVEVDDPDRVSYLVQTTLSAHEVDAIVAALRERFPALQAPPTDDICFATTNRQEALTAVAEESDLVLVVGSQNSSNSQRLVETSRRLGTPAHLVDDVHDVDLAWLVGAGRVGITAGASAPDSLVQEIVDALGGLGPVRTQHRDITREDIHFTLPKEVRSA